MATADFTLRSSRLISLGGSTDHPGLRPLTMGRRPHLHRPLFASCSSGAINVQLTQGKADDRQTAVRLHRRAFLAAGPLRRYDMILSIRLATSPAEPQERVTPEPPWP